jgi:hypothetical protein
MSSWNDSGPPDNSKYAPITLGNEVNETISGVGYTGLCTGLIEHANTILFY